MVPDPYGVSLSPCLWLAKQVSLNSCNLNGHADTNSTIQTYELAPIDGRTQTY